MKIKNKNYKYFLNNIWIISRKKKGLFYVFYLEWTSFYSFFILFNPRGPAYHGFKKTCFFWNRGLYVLELIPPRREKFVFSCVAFCDTLRLSRNIRVPHFNFFLPFFSFFFYLWSNKRRCCDEVHKAIMAINFTSRHGFSSFPNKTQSKK